MKTNYKLLHERVYQEALEKYKIYDMTSNLMTLCKTTKQGFENKLSQFIWSKPANKVHWLKVTG